MKEGKKICLKLSSKAKISHDLAKPEQPNAKCHHQQTEKHTKFGIFSVQTADTLEEIRIFQFCDIKTAEETCSHLQTQGLFFFQHLECSLRQLEMVCHAVIDTFQVMSLFGDFFRTAFVGNETAAGQQDQLPFLQSGTVDALSLIHI